MKILKRSVILLLINPLSLFCMADSDIQPEYLGKVSIGHSQQLPVLGISSIRYHKTNGGEDKLTLLSDDTGADSNLYGTAGKARYYTISLNRVWNGNKPITETYDEWADEVQEKVIDPDNSGVWINNGHVDTEGLALSEEGDLWIASEQGATYPLDRNWPFFHWFEWSVEPSLLHVKSDGKLVSRYRFPEYYSDTSWTFDLGTLKLHTNNQNKVGVARNKGIESIDRFPGHNRFLAITEGPLYQDRREWDSVRDGPTPSRLIDFSLIDINSETTGQIKPAGEYFYQQIPLPEDIVQGVTSGYPRRGVTDIAIINEDSALVLERSLIKYINNTERSVSEIYRIQLESSYNFEGSASFKQRIDTDGTIKGKPKTLTKRLIFRSTDYVSQEPALDSLNMEGLTFGPDFNNGDKLLIMVNDNGASDASKTTQLLFFRIPAKALL